MRSHTRSTAARPAALRPPAARGARDAAARRTPPVLQRLVGEHEVADAHVGLGAERGRARRVERGEAPPQLVGPRGIQRAGVDPLQGEEPRPGAVVAHPEHGGHGDRARLGQPAQACGLSGELPRGRGRAGLDERATAVVEVQRVGVVDRSAAPTRRSPVTPRPSVAATASPSALTPTGGRRRAVRGSPRPPRRARARTRPGRRSTGPGTSRSPASTEAGSYSRSRRTFARAAASGRAPAGRPGSRGPSPRPGRSRRSPRRAPRRAAPARAMPRRAAAAGRALVGRGAGMPAACPGAVELDLAVQAGLGQQRGHDALGRRRAADVPQADEEHAHRRAWWRIARTRRAHGEPALPAAGPRRSRLSSPTSAIGVSMFAPGASRVNCHEGRREAPRPGKDLQPAVAPGREPARWPAAAAARRPPRTRHPPRRRQRARKVALKGRPERRPRLHPEAAQGQGGHRLARHDDDPSSSGKAHGIGIQGNGVDKDGPIRAARQHVAGHRTAQARHLPVLLPDPRPQGPRA